MNMNVIGKLPVVMAALAASSVFAGPDTDSRVSQLEKQMAQVRTETENSTFGAKTATARPETDGYGLFLSFDVLYWRARVGGSEYCYTDQQGTLSFPIDGDIRDISPSWDWGFRIGAGYNFEHDGWDLGLQYTYFKTNLSSSQTAATNEDIVPMRGSAIITGFESGFTECGNASSNYNLFFQNLELQLGRDFFVSRYLSLRPSIGLQTSWINQEQKTTYSQGILGVNSVFVEDECDFWGMGPQVALSTGWVLGKGFSFFGTASGAVLYGNYKVSLDDSYSPTLKNQFPNVISINGDMHKFSPTVRLQVGIAYDLYLDNNKQHLGFALGYDTQYWFAQNQMLRVVDRGYSSFVNPTFERYSEDLGLQGITFEARWDF